VLANVKEKGFDDAFGGGFLIEDDLIVESKLSPNTNESRMDQDPADL
jgi:hypothetical protein